MMFAVLTGGRVMMRPWMSPPSHLLPSSPLMLYYRLLVSKIFVLLILYMYMYICPLKETKMEEIDD